MTSPSPPPLDDLPIIQPNNNNNSSNALTHMIAGSLSRLSESAIMFPLDTLKTRVQFQDANTLGSTRLSYRSMSVLKSLTSTAHSEGIKGLYRGFSPHLLYVIPASAISFVCYEAIAKYFKRPVGQDGSTMTGLVIPVLGMTVARLSGSIIRTPFDIVKMRMQVSGNMKKESLRHRSSIDQMNSIIKKQGYRGLFKYSYVTVMRDLPFSAIYFTSYEISKNWQKSWMAKHGGRKLNHWNHILSGAIAGTIGTIITIPIDVVKTKLQTQDTLPKSVDRFRGVWNALKGIMATEGPAGLTKGIGTRLVHVIPSAGLSFAFYEAYKKLLKDMMKDKTST
ncbi:hypothetical protein SAMD00019534_041980, partial [Acytostelium subglobosum LB1]|uniref:hypothetical protein n=1 Tax=Acytostelium subglobosum LB1 TaxID=1410327 RepID=UPI000644E77E